MRENTYMDAHKAREQAMLKRDLKEKQHSEYIISKINDNIKLSVNEGALYCVSGFKPEIIVPNVVELVLAHFRRLDYNIKNDCNQFEVSWA